MRSMPLQLMSIFTLIFLVLPPPFSTAGRYAGCRDWCGNLKIPYPFGVGSNCSFDPYFNITCNTSANPHKAYLSMLNKEVIEITDSYIRVKYPNLVSVCYDLSGGNGTNVTAKSYNQSMTVDLSGTPYTLSETNLLTAIGCDDMVVKSNGSWVGGGCSAFCADRNDTGGVGYCPNNRTSLGNGCCQSHIPGDGNKGSLGAELIDMSGNFLRRKLFSCSYAFIQEWIYWHNSAFSYPLYYLDNSTAFLKDDWASTSTPPVVRLSWSLGVENCSQARLNSTTFACQDSKTVCFDYADQHTIEEFKGYFCRCVEGYEGNPYLLKGCQAISLSNSIAKFGCPDQCGDLSILFPFGVGPNCYREPSFEIICNASIYPPKPYLAILKAEIIQLTNSSIRVKYPNQTGIACYNLSDYQRGITKTEEHRLIIDLLGSQYSLSDGNWITAVGCDDMVVGIVGQGNRSFVGASCASVCHEETDPLSRRLFCPFARDVTRQLFTLDGYGCCHAPIPRGTTYLEANLSDLSGQQQRSKFLSCSYVFVNYNDRFDMRFPVDFLNNSTAMQTKTLQQSTGSELMLDSRIGSELMLDWRIGSENCSEAKLNHVNFACQGNSECIEFDTKVGGYLCICSKGYQGNPYITSGCQDIDECANNTINPCNAKSSCNNTQGSVTCLCPKGYYGDGRKDGIGCINLQQVLSKQMIILIGMGSGLGFLVLLLLLFWLYKVLRKRKEQMIKEKFFKRNGGLLFQQQTNEGVFGKTKIFQANELVVATDNFNESRILGQGGQGTVYKGMLSDGKIVAIKKSKLVEENLLEQFINEVVILSQINHRNVVKLLGCCLEFEVPMLVYEFMPNGTLFNLIHDPNKEFPFPWTMRVKIAADIAGALAYLHSASSRPIYHRDVKSSNLLLDEKYVVKVSDFGTSRSISSDQTHLTTLVKGTFGYLDPEYFQSSQFTEKSDVYSFGVVLVELLTRQRPISFDKTEEERCLAARFLTSMEEQDLDTILDPQLLEQGRTEDVFLVARLAQRCLNLKGKMRPSMKEVATELEGFRISQMSTGPKDGFEEVKDFDGLVMRIPDTEYTWTTSDKSATTSSSDTYPLRYTAE